MPKPTANKPPTPNPETSSPTTPKPVSQRKLAANRKNARKSTGPKTPEGKKRSSLNALKHGLLAREVVIKSGDGAERAEDFYAFLTDLLADLKPVGLVEETLVERIATCYWRLRRAQRFEIGAVRAALDDCKRPDPKPDQQTLARLTKKTDKLRADLQDERDLLHDLRNIPDSADEPTRATVESRLRALADQFPVDHQHLTIPELLERLIPDQEKLLADMTQSLTQLESEIIHERRYQELARSRRRLTGSLPPHDTILKLIRYETMLDRQLHRAIGELRRRRTPQHQPPETK